MRQIVVINPSRKGDVIFKTQVVRQLLQAAELCCFASIPADEDLALYHDKTIETQIKTNQRYNEWFTDEENRGHGGYSNK